MPHKTKIQWCSHSSNPLRAEHNGKRGWSCEKISSGCAACYSEAMNKRLGTGLAFVARDNAAVTNYLDEKELAHMLKFRPKPPYSSGRERPSVFVCDMTDIFGEWVPDESLDRMFTTFALRTDVDWLVLTKRAKRMWKYLSVRNAPLPNVWLGVSVENQRWADERVPVLLDTPAAIRWVSYEPALGPVDFCKLSVPQGDPIDSTYWVANWDALTGFRGHKAGGSTGAKLDWIVVGGESDQPGQKARTCSVDWIRATVEQCGDVGTACFVKQLGSNVTSWPRCPVDCECGLHYGFKDRKAGDPSEWPAAIRVREFPKVPA